VRRALLLVVLLATGCGSSQHLADAAKYAPADAQAFVAVRASDPHWRDFVQLVLGRVPHARADAYALENGRVVAVDMHGAPPAHALADDARFRASQLGAPHGARGIGYVRGDVAGRRLHAIPGAITTVSANLTRRYRTLTHSLVPSVAVLQFRWATAWLDGEGMELRAASAGVPVAETERVRSIEQLTPTYAPGLFDEIPADAQSVLDVVLPPGAFENLPHLPRQLAALFPGPPADVAFALDQVFQGESAVYTRAGGETTIVTQPADLFTALKAIAGLPPLRRLRRTFLGGQLVLSTSERGLAVFRGGGAKLSTRLALPPAVDGVVYRAGRLLGWGERIGSDAVFAFRFARGSG
jgi:hypothetical protein